MPGVKVSPECQGREGPILARHPAWALGWAQRKTHSAQESIKGVRASPFLPPGCRLRTEPSLEKGLLTSELTVLVALRPSWVPGRKGRVGPRMAFSVH